MTELGPEPTQTLGWKLQALVPVTQMRIHEDNYWSPISDNNVATCSNTTNQNKDRLCLDLHTFENKSCMCKKKMAGTCVNCEDPFKQWYDTERYCERGTFHLRTSLPVTSCWINGSGHLRTQALSHSHSELTGRCTLPFCLKNHFVSPLFELKKRKKKQQKKKKRNRWAKHYLHYHQGALQPG